MTFAAIDQPLEVLLLEDDQAHAELVRRALLTASRNYRVRTLDTLAAARQAIAAAPPRIALVDMHLPDGLGTSLLPQHREQGDFPIVIMTSQGNEDAAVQAMKAGAFDYIVKSETTLLDLPHIIARTLREWDHLCRHREAEAALQESAVRYRRLSHEFETLLEGIPDVLALIDRDLRVVWGNAAARKVALPEVAWAVGRRCSELWHNRLDDCHPACPVRRAFDTGRTEEEIVERPRDQTLWGVKAFPLKDADGQVRNVIVLAADITEKVQLRAEVLRSGQLASLGELAAGVAHEINNPINGIINFGQLLADQSPEGKNRQYATSIIMEGKRVAEIIRHLLTFAGTPHDRRPLALSLPEVLDATLHLTDSQLQCDQIKLQLEIAPALPDIAGNRQQLQQVLLNLISNARYALNQRYPAAHPDKRIVIAMNEVTIGGSGWVRLMMTDFGTGIPPHLLPRVLDPFFTTKPRHVGTGLGLSIAHGIIKHHGGRMFISSVEHGHTRVVADFPVDRGSDKADAV